MHYRISKPRHAGNEYVVDVVEYKGQEILRRTTIKLSQATPFLEAVFHTLPRDIKILL